MAMKVKLGTSLGAGSDPGDELAQSLLKAVNISQKTLVPHVRY
jgi:hypothetical protein